MRHPPLHGTQPAGRPQRPASPPDDAELREPLVVFLSPKERQLVLQALGRRHRDRRRALLGLLGLDAAARSRRKRSS